MQNIREVSNDLYDIIQCCEKSNLTFFEFKSAHIQLQFSKSGVYNTANKQMDTDVILNNETEEGINLCAANEVITTILQGGYDNEDNNDIVVITSPFVGTVEFSNKIKLNSEEIKVNKGEVVCSVEAMKLYNDIVSPVTGIISKIMVEDKSFVEYEQPLIKIRTDIYE